MVGIIGGIVGGWILDAWDVNDNLTWIGSLVIVGATAILYVMRKTGDGRDATR